MSDARQHLLSQGPAGRLSPEVPAAVNSAELFAHQAQKENLCCQRQELMSFFPRHKVTDAPTDPFEARMPGVLTKRLVPVLAHGSYSSYSEF